MQPVAQLLRIAILGAGKIGSAFAAQFARAGHDVTAIARPGSTRLVQLQRDGAIVDRTGGRLAVQVADRLEEEAPFDLVIVTLLAHQAPAVLPALRRSAARAILFMCNTADPESLADAVGAERCGFGLPVIQATIDAQGRVDVRIGAAGQRSLLGEDRWVALFEAAGLPVRVTRAMPLWLRSHAPLCVAFESVSVAGQRREGGASWGEALTAARGVKAGLGLVEASGRPIHPAKRLLSRTPAAAIAAMLWSASRVRSFRELLAGGREEGQALVDAIVASPAAAARPDLAAAVAAMRPA